MRNAASITEQERKARNARQLARYYALTPARRAALIKRIGELRKLWVAELPPDKLAAHRKYHRDYSRAYRLAKKRAMQS